MRVLVVEDDVKIARFIRQGFEAEQHYVDCAHDVKQGISKTTERDYDLIVLDLRLPGGSGFEVLQALRDRQGTSMVIVVSAIGSVDDRIHGLELGADDYMVKPFSFLELRARARALLRRREPVTNEIQIGGLRVHRLKREAELNGMRIRLTAREYSLLVYFMANPGQILTRAMIADKVWALSFDPGTNVIDVYINYLRRKLGADIIKSVRGMGYFLDPNAVTGAPA